MDIREQMEEYRFQVGCRYPQLRELLAKLPMQAGEGIRRTATDGRCLFYGRKVRFEDMLHSLVHLLCGHAAGKADHFPKVWDLACDMAAEYIRTLLFPDEKGERIRQDVMAVLAEGGDPWEAEDIYRPLMNLYEDELEELVWGFRRDEHTLWGTAGAEKTELPVAPDSPSEEEVFYAADSEIADSIRETWSPLLEALAGGDAESDRWGLTPGSEEERARMRERNQLDFTRYLRRFSVFGEEMMLDPDSFDQIPYTFGLELYGNLPFIEPLEYADCFRVEDLVIAIDTSGSCSLDLVQEFLGEIRHILLDHDAFFRRMNVHVFQCDAYVREHVVIKSREDWERYTADLTIKGRRGTDFRPVFREVEEMIRDKEVKRLKGLFYFTDGEGIYPDKKPEYETAFVYSTAEALNLPGIPEWVTKLTMDVGGIV